MASIIINLETSCTIAPEGTDDRKVEVFGETRKTAIIVARIGYMSRKLRII